MGKPAGVENDLSVLQWSVVPPLPRQQPFDDDLSCLRLVWPSLPIGGYKSLAVVLVHRGVDALLRAGRSGDEIDPEAWIQGGRERWGWPSLGQCDGL